MIGSDLVRVAVGIVIVVYAVLIIAGGIVAAWSAFRGGRPS